MSESQKLQREWLSALVQTTGRSLTAIARKAGVHESTITRFMNDARTTHALSERTIRLISESEGVPFGQTAPSAGDWFAPYGVPSRTEIDGIVPLDRQKLKSALLARMLEAAPAELELWELRTEDLAAAGFRSGDLVLADRSVAPAQGDLVIISFSTGRADKATYFPRIFVPPFAMTATVPLARPQLVDNDSVRLVATATVSLRARNAPLV